MKKAFSTATVSMLCLSVFVTATDSLGKGKPTKETTPVVQEVVVTGTSQDPEEFIVTETLVSGGASEVECGPRRGLGATARFELQATGLFGYVGDFSPVMSEALADDWTKHTFDTDGGDGPICVAGTPFAAFTKRGRPSKLLIFLQGGGACWQDFYFCNILADTAPPPLAGPVSGVWVDSFDTGTEVIGNPFADWSVLYVPYCDGSVFAGDNDVVDANFPFSPVRFHRGLRNLTAALDLARTVFPHARDIVVGGSESGGTGASHHAPFLVRYLYGNQVDLSVFADASVFTPVNLDEVAAIQARADDWQFGQFFPASCTECDDAGQTTAIIDWRLDNDDTIREAYYSTDGDATNRFFSNVPTQEEWRTLILAEHGALHDAYPDRYKRFIRSGDDEHTSLQRETFYLGEADGVPLYQWTDDFLVPRPGWVDIVEDFVPIP